MANRVFKRKTALDCAVGSGRKCKPVKMKEQKISYGKEEKYPSISNRYMISTEKEKSEKGKARPVPTEEKVYRDLPEDIPQPEETDRMGIKNFVKNAEEDKRKSLILYRQSKKYKEAEDFKNNKK